MLNSFLWGGEKGTFGLIKGFLYAQVWWLKLYIITHTGAYTHSFRVSLTYSDLSLFQCEFSPEQGGQDPEVFCTGLSVMADTKTQSSCMGNDAFVCFLWTRFSWSQFSTCFSSPVVKLTSL